MGIEGGTRGLHETRKPAKEVALQHAQLNRDIISGDKKTFRKGITFLGLEGVSVQEGTEIRDSAEFDERMTFALMGDHEKNGVAALASSVTDHPVSMIYVVHNPLHSGLLIDDKNNRILTDSFFLAEKDGQVVIKHVKPTRPIHIDGIMEWNYTDEGDQVIDSQLTETEKKFADTADDKNRSKQVLQDAGIRVPKGIHFTRKDVAEGVTLKDLIQKIPGDGEIVFKPNDGSLGNDVVMGNRGSEILLDEINETIKKLEVKKGTGFLLEERIDPPPQPELAKIINDLIEIEGNFEPNEVDWNFRIITTIGVDPEVVDAEVRFGRKGSMPINVDKGASVVRCDTLKDPEMVANAYDTAKKTVSAVYRHAHQEGDPESTSMYQGVDVISDREGNMYVMEVQNGPGGFGTLAILDQKPLGAIADVLIPAQIPYLQKRFEERPQVDPKNLRRLKTDRTDIEKIFNLYFYKLGDYPAAEKIIYEKVKEIDYNDSDISKRDTLLDLAGRVVTETNNYEAVLHYLKRLLADYPDDEYYKEFKIFIENRQKLYQESQGHKIQS